jgi:hypothetical protein
MAILAKCPPPLQSQLRHQQSFPPGLPETNFLFDLFRRGVVPLRDSEEVQGKLNPSPSKKKAKENNDILLR